ncbi:hypothetical protein PENSUB_6046 [Penicillium subrubescens]|uniref:Uncharacterized protein n=1 Tax=Penicillium subrubescens TaxID=1316194 RepID=A0A1Q5U4Q3_9EURO|nr:hypothetical protein PENSUB_6046 [Penicillium subrubescens]
MASTRIDPDFDRYFQTMDWMDGDFIHEQSPPQHGAEPGRAYHSPTSTNHSHGPYIPEASECASQNAWHFPRGQNVSLQSYHGVNGGPSQHEPVPHNFDQRSSRAQATTGLLHQSSSGLPASHVAPANGEADREVSFSLSGQRTRRRYVAV